MARKNRFLTCTARAPARGQHVLPKRLRLDEQPLKSRMRFKLCLPGKAKVKEARHVRLHCRAIRRAQAHKLDCRTIEWGNKAR